MIKIRLCWAAALVALLAGVACTKTIQKPTPVGSDSLHVVRIGAMSVERAAHQATLLESGHVLITGGCAGNGCDLVYASAERYDPYTRSFRAILPMSTPRAGHIAVALLDGRVLVSGGWTGQQATDTAEAYDPSTGEWMPVGDMTEARSSHTAVSLADGRVLVVGGGAGGLGDLGSVEIFDPATSRFSTVGRMQTNHYLATALADGRVLVTGGQGVDGEILRSAEVFDPQTQAFRPTGEMTVPRIKHAAALLADGRVLIVGGSDEQSYRGRYTSTELYDPSTGVFSPGPELGWPRHKIRDAVAVLDSGAVLVAGGAIRPELWDPAGVAFVPLEGELSGPQMFATATVLPSGQVLVLGGYDERTRSNANAWLCIPDAEIEP